MYQTFIFHVEFFLFSPIFYFQLLLLKIIFVSCSYMHIVVILRATILQAIGQFPLIGYLWGYV
jgi:hypothetical protein